MKVTQGKGFEPITIVFETSEEAFAFRDFWGQSCQTDRIKISRITEGQHDILTDLWSKINALQIGRAHV